MTERQAMIELFAAARAQAQHREVTDRDIKEAADDVALMESIEAEKTA